MQPRCLGLTSCPCSHCSNPRPAGSPSALPGSKMLHVCVCTDAWKQAHTGRDAVLAVHTESFLLMYRHGRPAAASAQKPALVLEQYLQSLQQGNKWISLKMSSWEEKQSRPSLRSHLLAFTCYPSVLFGACRGAPWSYPCPCVWTAGQLVWATWSHPWNLSKQHHF